MSIVLNGTTGIANDGGYTGDGVVFADTTPANTLVTTTGGNVGVGTASPGYKLDVATIAVAVSQTGVVRFGANDQYSLRLGTYTTGGGTPYAQILAPRDSAGWLAFTTGTSDTERARIDSSGNFMVGTTVPASRCTFSTTTEQNTLTLTNARTDYIPFLIHNTATTGNNLFANFGTEASYASRGSITYNRGAGLTAYNTTSDYRAKDIIGPVVGSGELIDSTPVYMGKMKGATQERPMFIAHETPEYAHTGEKAAVDADGNPIFQQMDASSLVPVMWAELQSLRARVAALEGTQP